MRKYPKMMLAGLALISGLLFSLPVYAAEPDLTDSGYVAAGPGVVQEDEDTTSGMSLGAFTITGYCNCDSCSGGHNLTYSGTVPKANHTISADLNLFPIGTQLLINGTVYTVEDMGSSVNGKKSIFITILMKKRWLPEHIPLRFFDGTNI